MKFKSQKNEYRILFDIVKNQFIAVDANDEDKLAFGNTIEQAVSLLNYSK